MKAWNSSARWLTKARTRIRSVSAQLRKGRADGGILKKRSSSASIGGIGISCNGCGSRSQATVSVMMCGRGRMNTISMMRRGIVMMVDRTVRRMRIARMGEWVVRRVRMVAESVHGMVRMTRMVCVVNSVRMVTRMMVMMARMRTQIGSCCGGRGSVRQTKEVSQVLPPMLHAHRTH